jgi:hypothetical protein
VEHNVLIGSKHFAFICALRLGKAVLHTVIWLNSQFWTAAQAAGSQPEQNQS